MFTPERPLTATEIRTLLESYAQMSPPPEYAILLDGKWGCGKTWLVNHIFQPSEGSSLSPNPDDSDKQTTHQEVIYISLFGKESLTELEREFFSKLHPFLSGKHIDLLKKALFSIQLPYIQLENLYTSISDIITSLNSIESENKKCFFLIFDDFERSKIDSAVLLGYFNRLLLTKNVRIVCVTNTEKISNIEKPIFDLLHEKIFESKIQFIGADFNDIYSTYIDLLPQEDNFKNQLQQTWNSHKHYHEGNCRALKRLLDVLSNFNSKMGADIDFEIRNELLVSLFNRKVHALNSDEKVAQSLYLTNLPILQEKTWKDICNNIINSSDIARDIIAYKEESNNHPLWLKLWRYEELPDDKELQRLENEALQYLNSLENLRIEDVLHLSAALFEMHQNQCSFTNPKTIQTATEKALSNLKSTSPQKFSDFFRSSFNGQIPDQAYGYGFRGRNSQDFKQLLQLARRFYVEIEKEHCEAESKECLRNHGFLSVLRLIKDKRNHTHDIDLLEILSPNSLSCSETVRAFADTSTAFSDKIKSCDLILELTREENSKDKEWRTSLIKELNQELQSLSPKISKYRMNLIIKRLNQTH